MNIIHIGFPKTATTLLQKNIFNQLPQQINYVYNKKSKELFSRIYNDDNSIIDIHDLHTSFNKLYKRNDIINLFSHEFLTGLHQQTGFINRSIIAERLKTLGFQKIILTIRNQFDVLESTYKQYIRDGGVLKFKEFYPLDERKSMSYFPVHRFHLEYFNYFKIIKLYSDLFGFDNLCILQYEDLRKDQFFRKLIKFLEIPDQNFSTGDFVNQSLTWRASQILRIINHFTFNPYRPSHLISKKISTNFFYKVLKTINRSSNKNRNTYISNDIKSDIYFYYKDSNKKLVEEFSINLDPSYPV